MDGMEWMDADEDEQRMMIGLLADGGQTKNKHGR
jgi:hypothetical protein|tara:strand:- start:877 stop:978 length:102 start_codon:yes stop_codon:yes gene_type:complete